MEDKGCAWLPPLCDVGCDVRRSETNTAAVVKRTLEARCLCHSAAGRISLHLLPIIARMRLSSTVSPSQARCRNPCSTSNTEPTTPFTPLAPTSQVQAKAQSSPRQMLRRVFSRIWCWRCTLETHLPNPTVSAFFKTRRLFRNPSRPASRSSGEIVKATNNRCRRAEGCCPLAVARERILLGRTGLTAVDVPISICERVPGTGAERNKLGMGLAASATRTPRPGLCARGITQHRRV